MIDSDDLKKALDEADALNPPVVTIPAQDWEAFEAWINRPAQTIQVLVELARRSSIHGGDIYQVKQMTEVIL
jgi:hypothetical protein